jgi:hypothetical protein
MSFISRTKTVLQNTPRKACEPAQARSAQQAVQPSTTSTENRHSLQTTNKEDMEILLRNQVKGRSANAINAIYHIGNAAYTTSACIFGLGFADTFYSGRANMGVMDFSLALMTAGILMMSTKNTLTEKVQKRSKTFNAVFTGYSVSLLSSTLVVSLNGIGEIFKPEALPLLGATMASGIYVLINT